MTEWAKDIIEAEGLGTFDTDLFISQNPDKEDVTILYDEAGIPDAVDNAYGRDGYGLMVMTRGSYSYAKDQIWNIHRALVGRTLEAHDDGTLVQCMIQAPPQYVENDDKGRRVFTAHYVSPVEQSDAGQRIAIT
jgi:hypothetical protein